MIMWQVITHHDKEFGDFKKLLYTSLVDGILSLNAVFQDHICHYLLQFL
jgi:hypothetical protein